jgi:hypothetical protein
MSRSMILSYTSQDLDTRPLQLSFQLDRGAVFRFVGISPNPMAHSIRVDADNIGGDR